MNRFLSDPLRCIALAGVLLLVVSLSDVPELWAASFAAFILAVLALGWHRSPPVLVWIVAFNMLSIWADIAIIDLTKQGWATVPIELNQEDAIYFSSCALLFLALGMRLGESIGAAWIPLRSRLRAEEMRGHSHWSPRRIALGYFAFIPLGVVANVVGGALPGLTQPLYALGLLKFVLIYWLSATIFSANKGYVWLVVVIAAELVMGSTGAFASYKEGFFVVLIAFAGSNRRLSLPQLSLALAGCALIVYMSLVWSVVKQEYRSQIMGQSDLNSVAWLGGKYFGGDVDFQNAALTLLQRIGYTKFYAMVLNSNTEQLKGIYARAVLHVLTPRLLFPEKAILDDSKQTNEALGWNIAQGTSIGLGYVAQAHIDFGFPGLLGAMLALGAIVGLMYWYFRSRAGPAALCDAFAVGCLFNVLPFAGNIDKELGGLIMGFLLMMLVMKFGKDTMLRLASGQPPRHAAASRAYLS